MLRVTVFALCAALCYADASNQVVRPCALNDYNCIADNLAANSYCKKVVNGRQDPVVVIPSLRFEAPYFNATYFDNNLTIRGRDRCYLSEFFFNVNHDTCVITIDCPNLGIESTRTLIQHYTAQEDTTYSFKYNGVYPLVRITVNLKHANKMDLCSAFAFADVTALPNYIIDPTDQPTANFLSHDLSFLNIYERESFLYRAPKLIKSFIQKRLCDFGCPN